MIHFNCDACKRALGSDELRYVVRMEVYTALGTNGAEIDDDRDHLQEIHEYLERLDESCEQLDDEACQQLRFDLCEECRKNFLRDPLGRRINQPLDFSKN
jgi:hypothetical protein